MVKITISGVHRTQMDTPLHEISGLTSLGKAYLLASHSLIKVKQEMSRMSSKERWHEAPG